MKKIIYTIILSIVTAIVFVFFVRSDLLRKVPGFYCEGFGCTGLGVVYFFLALLVIPLVFGTAGFLLSREERLKQLLISGSISFVMMLLSLVTIYALNQMDIRQAEQEEERMMRELYQRLNIPDHPVFREKSLFEEPSR